MAEAASSATATALTPAPPSRTDTSGTIDVIDADTIRQTFSAVLRATHPCPSGNGRWSVRCCSDTFSSWSPNSPLPSPG